MAKIKLLDGTVLAVENGSTAGCLCVIMDDVSNITVYVDALTSENLVAAEIVDDNEQTVAILKSKRLEGFDCSKFEDEEKYMVCFQIRDLYTLEERIIMLEAENAELRASQEIQDEAIVELADIIAEQEVSLW